MDARAAHQACHPFAADLQPQAHPQLGVHARCPVGAPGVLMDLHDQPGQLPILELACGWRATDRLVVGRRCDLENPAGHRDGEPVHGQLLDQPDHCFGRTFSRAK